MIAAKNYYTVYLIIVTIITFFVYSQYIKKNGEITYPLKAKKSPGTLLLAIFMTIFIGFRPENYVFVDMMNYIIFYYALYQGEIFTFDWNAENLLFDNYFAWIGSLDLGTTFFLRL